MSSLRPNVGSSLPASLFGDGLRGLKISDLFSASSFLSQDREQAFHRYAVSMKRNIDLVTKPPGIFRFLGKLADRGKLVRLYTQNIDGLETLAGLRACIDDDKTTVVRLRGDLHTLKCRKCLAVCVWEETHTQRFESGEAPGCSHCQVEADRRERESSAIWELGD
jgi:NAD-dependent histone deacetylase SIR2